MKEIGDCPVGHTGIDLECPIGYDCPEHSQSDLMQHLKSRYGKLSLSERGKKFLLKWVLIIIDWMPETLRKYVVPFRLLHKRKINYNT